jgi:hypothetical protein
MMALPPDRAADASPIDDEIWNPRSEDCQSEIVRQILEYWQFKCRGRKMPARADLDPLEMRGALNQMVMIEIHRDPLRFRTRLVGSEQVKNRGFDFTANWLDELPDGYRSVVLPRAEAVAMRGESVRSRIRRKLDDRLFDYETVWLPLGADGETATMIMVVQEFFS